MSRFVILLHDWPVPHWDLLLESGPVLKAWRLLAEPALHTTISAAPNFDHRLMYLDYEGPVSGERGNVTRWDAGEYDGEPPSDAGGILHLHGTRFTGTAVFELRESGWFIRFVTRELPV